MSATLPFSYEPFFPSPFAERPAALKPCPLGYESLPRILWAPRGAAREEVESARATLMGILSFPSPPAPLPQGERGE